MIAPLSYRPRTKRPERETARQPVASDAPISATLSGTRGRTQGEALARRPAPSAMTGSANQAAPRIHSSGSRPRLPSSSRATVSPRSSVASSEGSQSAVPILGESSVSVAPVHWVDTNADGRIDDAEMLEGSFTIEDMSGVHIDFDDLENLWDAGSYRWDNVKGVFIPDPDRS